MCDSMLKQGVNAEDEADQRTRNVIRRPAAVQANYKVAGKTKMESFPAQKPSSPHTGEASSSVVIPAMSEPAFLGLIHLRPGLLKSIEMERMRLRAAAHDVSKDLEIALTRFNQNMDHLKFLNRKVAEKRDKLERAVEEHARAHETLIAETKEEYTKAASRVEDTAPASKRVIKVCETLVRSFAENVESSNRSLSRWEFKARRQAVIVNHDQDDVQVAQAEKAANATKIEAEVFQMLALSQFIKGV